MSANTLQFRNNLLRYCNNDSEYDLYRAALEWDLMEPIVIENRDDMRSEIKWGDRLDPYHHQVVNLITFCRRLPVTLLADDVGLGKTISAGLIASELMSRGRVSKILVVCPKLLMPQWREELDAKFGISSIEAVGSDLAKVRPPEGGGAVITTYHSTRIHIEELAKTGFEMLILDEAHKLRNLYGVDPPPQVAIRVRKALADRLFKYVLMLTATPIHNRLWDLYSLIDLLTVARGHENPFGSEGLFARNFISDSRTQARQLKAEKQDEFRSIVYGYMSRVRRDDANLYFPERKVQLHRVDPSPEEKELIEIISQPIQELNRLAQISILQALVSSPHALSVQLDGMAQRGTVQKSLANDVRNLVEKIKVTSKLRGLGALVEKLKTEQPEHWRVVVFTTRRETQTTIQIYLEALGVTCGLINGDSSIRNQDSITRFKKDPPEIHTIISTEAGSEGINLQKANVLINYDLPWNPMIVEQRIGRIQRLASEHASVCIFNIILEGTFEEYIVGRLMEKLQMASQAIGDVEALLEATDLDQDEDSESTSFEERIRQLVVASLAGKDVEIAMQRAEKSISSAKEELKREEGNINELLGGMGDVMDSGPRCPKLQYIQQSMDARSFVFAALTQMGARLTPMKDDLYSVDMEGKQEIIRFNENEVVGVKSVLYEPGTAAFERLVNRITGTSLHRVEDVDKDAVRRAKELAETWVKSFDGILSNVHIGKVQRCFNGSALLRVRATVAHDGYERLVKAQCSPEEHFHCISTGGLEAIHEFIENPKSIGLNREILIQKALSDSNISDFCRFYNERKSQEMAAAGADNRKRKKLEDDFTPRLEILLVGLDGVVYRQLTVEVCYCFEPRNEYKSTIVLTPSTQEISTTPAMDECKMTMRRVPLDCLDKCAISNTQVLKHFLVRSDISGRMALAEHTTLCAMTNKRVLADEVETSAITGQPVAKTFLKTSALSGKCAEPQYFGKCEFSGSVVLEDELMASQISGKRYRIDEQLCSAFSGKTGHRHEFIYCSYTNQPLLPNEAERCEQTGKVVMPGILELCEASEKMVLPSLLEKSSVSGKKALKKFFVSSSMSGARFLEEEAVKSIAGKYCAPMEAKLCLWSGRKCHPDDLRVCALTGVTVHSEYIAAYGEGALESLLNLLNGITKRTDGQNLWNKIAVETSTDVVSKRSKVEAAELSPNGQYLAVVLEVKTWAGLKVRHAGLLYSIHENRSVGHIRIGKREKKEWVEK